MHLLLAIVLLGSRAAETFEYPFGPFTDLEDAKIAQSSLRRLQARGGIARAIRRLCASGDTLADKDSGRGSDGPSWEVETLVVSNFLIEHADRAYPQMLDAIIQQDRAPERRQDPICRGALEGTVRLGVCFGYDIGGTGPALDAQPLAIERRARARRALIGAIAHGGRRGKTALGVLLTINVEAICVGRPDVVRDATPALLRWLGRPHPGPQPPARPGPGPDSASALRALSFGPADRDLAEGPVSAFAADDATMPLAALALARMGADATDTVPRLARILDATGPQDLAQGPHLWDRLTRIDDTLDALAAIGPSARAALPSVAGFVARVEIPACRTFGANRFAKVVDAIGTPADADLAVAALAPLLACAGSPRSVVEVLGRWGAQARPGLLMLLRDNARPIEHRLDAAGALARTAPPLEAPDRKILRRLEAKQSARATMRQPPQGANLAAYAAAELARCRSEAGRPATAADAGSAATPSWDFATCLSEYLCGPAPETYRETMARCCQRAYPNQAPPFCASP
jgi:hypothetical protein